jgi:hypothetical protein
MIALVPLQRMEVSSYVCTSALSRLAAGRLGVYYAQGDQRTLQKLKF